MELLESSSVASERDQFKKYLNFYSVHSKTHWLVPCMNTAKKKCFLSMVIIMIVFQLQTSCLYTNVLLESLAIKKVLL